jgi:Dynein, heavy chain
MEVYKSAVLQFLPTPSKSHYIFNLRDFARVIRGVLLVPSSHLNEHEKLIRLWIHESYRVFCDRLVNEEDRYVIWSKGAVCILCDNIEVNNLFTLSLWCASS